MVQIMGSNPVMLGVRFVLEMTALIAVGWWGWYAGNGGLVGLMLAIALPLLLSTFWAVFGTTGDKVRGDPVVPVSGKVRLVLELTCFVLAVTAFYGAQAPQLALIYGAVALVQNLLAYDRIGWLLQN